MADLLINNKDAYSTWGVRMGDGFLDAISAPVSLKPFVENKSRLNDGKSVIVNSPKKDERDITLTFTIEGTSQSDFISKKNLFFNELYLGEMDIKVPDNSNDVYHLIYLGKSITYAQSIDRKFAKVSAKFNEPNPANRV